MNAAIARAAADALIRHPNVDHALILADTGRYYHTSTEAIAPQRSIRMIGMFKQGRLLNEVARPVDQGTIGRRTPKRWRRSIAATFEKRSHAFETAACMARSY
ncbi:MAG TPA: hypothetical protein VEC06_08920 [Paucimonas sp.]|nr:hypothetical protein [Paucimonas sp.]